MKLVRGGLETGDLCVAALPDGAVVERKAVSDLYGCMGKERERFERERLVITQEDFLRITGTAQTDRGLPMVRAERVERLVGPTLAGTSSHDFH